MTNWLHLRNYKSIKPPVSTFEIDRFGLDRAIFTAYYPSVVKQSHLYHFDISRVERLNLEDQLVSTFFKNRKESVLHWEEGDYLWYELRLKETRVMVFRFNFNRAINAMYSLKHNIKCPVIHDNNFIPIDSSININNFLEMYKEVQNKFINIYKSVYSQVFNDDFSTYENEEPVLKCNTLELYRELSPLSVSDIRDQLLSEKKHFKSYNSQSKTMYFGEKPKIEGMEEIRDGNANLMSDVHSWNDKKYDEIFQAKLYQKSVVLARFERTIYGSVIDDNLSVDDIKWLLDEAAEKCGLTWKRKHELRHDEVIEIFAKILNLDNGLVDMLFNEGIYWEATRSNRVITQKLKRRGVIEKSMRGTWIKSEQFKTLIRPYMRPKEEQKLLNIPRLI